MDALCLYTLAPWPCHTMLMPPLSLSSVLGISWRAASPIGGYALPADSLGLASTTLGATLALSVFGAGFADCLLWWAQFHLREGVRASVAGWD